MPQQTLFESKLMGCSLVRRGKVRDIYSLDNARFIMIVACDRISAFDSVLPTPIPEKGIVLTKMSNFWFKKTEHIVRNHLVDGDPGWMDGCYGDKCHHQEISDRATIVLKAEPLPVESIVRGYLAGSGWREYQATGRICGIALPEGKRESEKLAEPLFTPSTKAEEGAHDENISFEKSVDLVGMDLAEKVRDLSLQLYSYASEYALTKGIIIADTKFEFGLVDGELVLIDEVLTPDSSRFWPLDSYAPGGPQTSFDKQFVRDYLESVRWNKKPPAPALPTEIIARTSEKYWEALRLLTEVDEKSAESNEP